jgi:hypothetical protein
MSSENSGSLCHLANCPWTMTKISSHTLAKVTFLKPLLCRILAAKKPLLHHL